MVDRKTVEIAVDSRGVVAGLKEADKAFDQTARKADKAEKEVKQVGQTSHETGRNMSAAFAATGGGLAITHGLEGIATGFRSGNSAMSAFAASQALLDLGRFAEDMKGVTSATGGATTVFGTLGAIIKAHPLMTIATVLAAAASAMAIFSDDTGEAADEMERLGEAMQRATTSQYAQQVLGLSQDPGVRGRQAAVIGALEQYGRGGLRTFGQFGRELGLEPGDLEQRLRAAPPEVSMAMPRSLDFRGRYTEFAEQRIPKQAAEFIVRQLYRELLNEARDLERTGGQGTIGYGIDMLMRASRSLAPRTGAEAMGPTLPPGYERFADPSLLPLMRDRAAAPQPQMMGPTLPPGFSPYADPSLLPRLGNMQGVYTGGAPTMMQGGAAPGTGMLGFGMDRMMQASIALADYQREQADLAKQRMDELVALGEDFGATIGDAFFRVAEGTATARQAAAELVRMFAQMAATGIFRQIGGTIGGAFAPTQTQATANAAPAPTSMVP